MSPAMVQAIALLLSEAMVAGVTISRIVDEGRRTGAISDETMEMIRADLHSANELWENS